MIVGLVRLGKGPKGILHELSPTIVELFRPSVNDCRPIAKLDMPSGAFDPEREQYLASRTLSHMERNVERPPNSKILGLTGEDLYVHGLNFVFGQARCPGSSAIISSHRLDPPFYGERPNEELFLDRIVKEAVHELGHTFGLDHCRDPKCVMSFSNSIVDVDRKGPTFCKSCRRRLSPRA